MSDPTQLPPIELQVYDLDLLSDNTVLVWLRFEDGADIALEFRPDSPLSESLLELLERGANDMLRRLGQRGIKLTGFTPADDEDEA